MLRKLEEERIHIGVLGRVSVGKSSLLNALLGEPVFSVSPLHGETKSLQEAHWQPSNADTYQGRGVFLLDTPGLDEVEGEGREALAHEAAGRVDLLLFVVDGDLMANEEQALRAAAQTGRPVLLVLNKADQLTDEERELLVSRLRARVDGVIDPTDVLTGSANPGPLTYLVQEADGTEREEQRPQQPDVLELKDRLWAILERDGRTLAAINAGLFASDLSDRVAERLQSARADAGERLIHIYSLAKGVAVAVNPVPLADIAAALAVDVSLIVHLSKVYGLPLTSREASGLIATIVGQLAALMGSVWAVHLVSSALKLGTAGFSTLVTAGAQGAVGYYGTYVVGKVAEQYLVRGKSWGDDGPKKLINDILGSLDRDSILAAARTDIMNRLKSVSPGNGS